VRLLLCRDAVLVVGCCVGDRVHVVRVCVREGFNASVVMKKMNVLADAAMALSSQSKQYFHIFSQTSDLLFL
jgi:hypothetical protein